MEVNSNSNHTVNPSMDLNNSNTVKLSMDLNSNNHTVNLNMEVKVDTLLLLDHLPLRTTLLHQLAPLPQLRACIPLLQDLPLQHTFLAVKQQLANQLLITTDLKGIAR